MNRLIIRVSIQRNVWLLPFWWRNHYTYRIRQTFPSRMETTFGHRLVWLCFDCELSLLPKGAYWNPDGTAPD